MRSLVEKMPPQFGRRIRLNRAIKRCAFHGQALA
jgi:hypothetical protein